MKVGQNVKLKGYGGKEIIRRIVGLDKDTVIVCQAEEYKKALLEKREPVSVGFPIKYVIGELAE